MGSDQCNAFAGAAYEIRSPYLFHPDGHGQISYDPIVQSSFGTFSFGIFTAAVVSKRAAPGSEMNR